MSDPRFARLSTDPRFRRPKQNKLKVEIDERFKDVLESEEFGGKGKGKASGRVDKRGRPLAGTHHADQLKRFYKLRSPSPGAEGEDGKEGGFVDYARGGGALESSGSEDDSEEEEGSENEFDEEELEVGGKRKMKLPGHISESDSEESDEDDEDHLNIDLSENEFTAFPSEGADDEDEDEEEEESVPPTKRIAAVNLDWDNLQATDLFSVFNSFLQMASSSKKGESSTSGEKLGKLVNVKIYPSEFGKERMAKEEQEGPGGGIFLSKHTEKKKKGPKEAITTRRRDEESEEEEDEDEASDEEVDGEEDLEGSGEDESELDDQEFDDDDEEEEEDEEEEDDHRPPKRSNDRPREEIDGLEIVSDVESDAGSEDIDMDQLRQYQLERLRYFYAIATFSTVAAAEHVMDECNGTEFERTANVMDLSYVPDGMEFADEEIRDEANKEAKGYRGNDFVTDALRHSKVKLTWDQDDPNRVKMTRRTLTREEIEEQDFNKLVAGSGSEISSSEEEEDEEEISRKSKGKKVDKKSKKASKKERTEKLRQLLLAGNEEDGDIWGKAGTSFADRLADPKESKANKDKLKKDEMEITFKPALSGKSGGEIDEENMTTLEKYQLRMKEKKNRKKEKLELKRATKAIENDEDDDVIGTKGDEQDDFFGSDSDNDRDNAGDNEEDDDEEEEISFEKPKKSNTNGKKLDPKPKEEDVLELIGSSSKPDTNFSMKDIIKSEKDSKKRRRHKKSKKIDETKEREEELGPNGWKINVSDPRFKAIHEEAEYAIDPSNPHFTKTKAMQDLLTHRNKLRQSKSNDPSNENVSSASGIKRTEPGESNGNEKDLSQLVKSVKRQMEREGGKKRKRSRK
ncbi:uncharacterized protein I206_104265 [Kwoniella pini CBS 10737]|uniref:Uncharacterized protein n=1 Tax=Kwoniella pini CBS 10737 TaxID=1296096 RepID=A0A1B9I289_9TREE|nr:uncharacterized protein I206_04159 [Kwoniella pini CBS 10737]OCF49637.1 hypothetical protein I206_04159 [Kwoniella pini CBS 10737]